MSGFAIRVLMMVTLFVSMKLVSALILRRYFDKAWEKWLGRVVKLEFLLTFLGISFMGAHRALGLADSWRPGLIFVSLLMIQTLLLFGASLIVVLPLEIQRFRSRQQPNNQPVDPGRRVLLGQALAAVPAATVPVGVAGTVAGLQAPVLTEVDISVPNLHPDLDGMTILQLSDIHLGTYIDVDQVQSILDTAKEHSPDLIVLTGDVADDFSKMGPALEAIGKMNAPMGAFACIGNHEIYRGRESAVKIYANSPVTYLCDGGTLVKRGAGKLWIGGSDDPARLGADHGKFLIQAVGRAMEKCPADVDAKLLLCHRPEGFDAAVDWGVTLTLSGHTHGGQVAVAGRSVFEPFAPDSYLLGHYERAGSQLYTTAGLGHWMPFRVNCPCEGVLITFRRAEAA